MEKKYYAHETAIIDDGAEIGEGTKIWHYSHIAKGAKIGKNCKLGQNVYIAPGVIIGNNVKIQNNVSLYEGAVLEDNVFCGPSSVFTNIFNPRSAYPRNSEEFFRKSVMKEGASVGANATIVCGSTLGRHSFVGAGSVVTKDVPDHCLVYGNPAKPRGWMCECGEKLEFKDDKAICNACQKKYKKVGNAVERVK
jgi:UDP-2-acetamido-3-amino-2,3-dideoxy-glucuronate N-acetyltransferase